MKLFGITIARTQSLDAEVEAKAMQAVRSSSGWWGTIRESFTGAWQRNVECETTQNILAFSAVYSCVTLIADDIAKLRLRLMNQVMPGLWEEITAGSTSFLPVLRKPNRYQTRIQFIACWIVSKLLYGNTYVFLERDERNVVVAEHVLDPRLVVVLVASDGSVWYQLKQDNLSGITAPNTFSADDIIHDRMNCLWHPLVGVTPIYACGSSATQGIRIQANSSKFFENMSRPSIHLGAPTHLPDVEYARIKEQVESATSGQNLGRILITGNDMKMTVMSMPAQDAQLIEQLRWTVEDVARCFKVPLHKLGMGQPTLNNVAALNQDYYSQCLQTHIESIELLEDEALGLPRLGYGVEFDLDGLLRMDPISRADRSAKLIGAGVLAPNEGRLIENLPPAEGGDSPMIQQQNYSLAALAKRDAQDDPFGTAKPAPAADPVEPDTTDAGDSTAAAEEAAATEKRLTALVAASVTDSVTQLHESSRQAMEKMIADAFAKFHAEPQEDEDDDEVAVKVLESLSKRIEAEALA